MIVRKKRLRQARTLRTFRKIHRTTAIFLFAFFLFISLTGLLLGWKKNSGELILPKSHIGTSTNLKDWKSIDTLHTIANAVLHNKVASNLSLKIDRIDIRKEKGMVKFIYKEHFWEIQLDGATGDILSIGKRNSDLIENIHDGSILDNYFGTKGYIKLTYTTLMGLALFVFTVTGFWLWYGPKRMRRS